MPTPPSSSPVTPGGHQPDSHYDVLKSAFPPWLGHSSQRTRDALKTARYQHGSALGTAPAPLKMAFKTAIAEHGHARNQVDLALKKLEDAKAFAKPLLEDALLKHFNMDLNSETVYLRLYIAQTIPWFPLRTGAVRTWTVSLLDAALHNFEAKETEADAFEADSTYISRPSASGQFETLPAIKQVLSVTAFTRLCRKLDIGAQYARHVREALGLDEPVAASVLQQKVMISQKAALRAALQLARINGDIAEDAWRAVGELIDGKPALLQDRQPLRAYDLCMMDAPLNGILLFATDLERTRTVQRVVAYIPDDPHHPLKEYASSMAFKQALTEKLRNEQYQAFFSRFVSHEHRGPFFSGLSQRLSRIAWHPPQSGSVEAPWRKEPTTDPRLNFSTQPITAELWLHTYQQRLNQIINDARTLAVSTAAADRKARWAAWDAFVNVAASILNVVVMLAAPFIPGLGELMLGYMAFQLLDEVFEGVIDWAQGLGTDAFGHLLGVVEALVQLGAFGAGVKIGAPLIRQALPSDVVVFLDRFKPVTLANGEARYWKPDLAAYERDTALSPRMGVNELGLHDVRGESILPLEGKLYALETTANPSRYRIKHPTRPAAYTPSVRHNHSGAWHTELERPQQWDKHTLLRRLGHHGQGLSTADRELALHISGVSEGGLRHMHVKGDPLPPLLEDSLARVRIDRDLQRLIEQLRSDDPAVVHRIDPQDTLQLLTTHGKWPATKALRILTANGETAWEFGDNTQPVIELREDQLQNGDWLQTVLKGLSPEEIRSQFGERASEPELSLENRARRLRLTLADIAERQRHALFESRYAPLQAPADPHARQITATEPGLPAALARRLAYQASGAEMEALDQRRTPIRLAQMAKAAWEEVQLSRAYEGQYLPATASLDSDRLALNSLPLLQGWSPQVRLEVRHRSLQGPVWSRIGPDESSVTRTLVRTDSGHYVPYHDDVALFGETDLYSAILKALPDAQRDALHIEVTEGDALKLRLRQQPLPREALRVLLDHDTPATVRVETLRLLGSNGAAVAQVVDPTAGVQAEALFPTLRPQQLQALLERLDTQPGGRVNRLAALPAERQHLEQQLLQWQENLPANHLETGLPLNSRERLHHRRDRRLLAEQIVRCWDRLTPPDPYFDRLDHDNFSLRLTMPIMGELPVLDANFDHVSLLSLNGSPLTLGTPTFLARFTQLRHLEVANIPLGHFPAHLSTLPHLTTLGLSNCNLTLTTTTQADLASMRRLQSLTLDHNPLGLAPSVAAMPELNHLDLANTGIDGLPSGLLTRTHLDAAILSGNQISELPDALFELPTHSSDALDLSENPLSIATLDRIKQHCQAHDIRWQTSALATDTLIARQLYPTLSAEHLDRLIFALPGDIAAGTTELTRLAAELQTLQQQLSDWATTPGLLELERARRLALSNLLERCWRRQPPQETLHLRNLMIPKQMAGELPTLSARINHTHSLLIQGNGGTLRPSAFLESFPQLDILDIENARLGDIPSAVFNLHKLSFLGLPRCSITLSPASVQALQRMTQLEYLDLSHNPVVQLPDFQTLPRLTSVFLVNSGLSEVPAGLVNRVLRSSVNLTDNHIEALPAELLSLPPTITHAFDLSGNPLSRATLDQIKRYSHEYREHFNAQAPQSERDRIRRLYPTLMPAEADRFFFQLPGNLDAVPAALARLEAEYAKLTSDLHTWTQNVPERHPLLDTPLDATEREHQQAARRHFKRLIEQAWRREGDEDEESLDDALTHRLELEAPIMGALPQLTARFDHVTWFGYTGIGETTDVDGTLRCFFNLQSLSLRRCHLGDVPNAVFSMMRLSNLDMTHCAITLSRATRRKLGQLLGLEFLELSHNPLTLAPDVSHLEQLTLLHLREAQLSELPRGVFQLNNLHTLDLSHNQITHVTHQLLDMAGDFDQESDLSANPLSDVSLERLREYYLRTGIHFNVPQAVVDEEGNPLVPPLPWQDQE